MSVQPTSVFFAPVFFTNFSAKIIEVKGKGYRFFSGGGVSQFCENRSEGHLCHMLQERDLELFYAWGLIICRM